MRAFVTAGSIIALSLAMWGCDGNGYTNGTGNPVTPTPQPDGSGVVTINIVAINGAQSFSPNPATVASGQTVVWHNVDSVTHRVVLNDRSVDTGNLAPGASSQPMTLSGGGQYHCSIHPEMIGSVNQVTSAAPPCEGPYCN